MLPIIIYFYFFLYFPSIFIVYKAINIITSKIAPIDVIIIREEFCSSNNGIPNNIKKKPYAHHSLPKDLLYDFIFLASIGAVFVFAQNPKATSFLE